MNYVKDSILFGDNFELLLKNCYDDRLLISIDSQYYHLFDFNLFLFNNL